MLDKVAEKYGHTFHYTAAAMGGEATDLATLTATLEYRDGVLSLGVDFLLEAVGGV